MRRPSAGFSLLELIVAMALSLVLIAASFEVLQRCRSLFVANESLAQAQDAARHALAVLIQDVEHAGFYGVSSATAVELVAHGAVLASGDDLRQPSSSEDIAPAPGLPPGAHDCGTNFGVDLMRAVQASDSVYTLGHGECEPAGAAGGARAGSDTLTVRHASLEPAEPRAGRLQVHTIAASSAPLRIFADGRGPVEHGGNGETRDLEVRTYYVANHSVGNPGLPALRAKSLTESRGAVQFRDEEVMPGVEDLQVELGVRTLENGVPALRYVTADDPSVGSSTIVAVRVWLRVRAETADPESPDSRTLSYSNMRFTPNEGESRYRRLVVTRTVALRNRT
jgi:type IV pilus assembly protein PilW